MHSTKAFVARFLEYRRKHHLLGDGDRILVAVSGGVDSMVLLDLLSRYAKSVHLEIAHVNHSLRGRESEQDEGFVKGKAEMLGIPFHTTRVDTETRAVDERTSIQDAARTARYQFFESVRTRSSLDQIATAHHADDSAETILFNLIRGTGLAGLTGIHPERSDSRIIRPMLFAERVEIEEYARLAGVEFRQDSSNLEEHYTRNFIRQQIIPRMKSTINPSLAHTLTKTGELFREMESFVDMKAQLELANVVVSQRDDGIILSISALQEHHKALQRLILHRIGKVLTREGLGFDNVDSLLELLDLQTGSRAELPGHFEALRDRDRLIIAREFKPEPVSLEVEKNKHYIIDGWRFSSEEQSGGLRVLSTPEDAEYIDADTIAGKELLLRSWREGDTFIPLGMQEKKKVSDFLINAKVPLFEKHHHLILETSDHEVIWLCGLRIDERFKVTERTRRVLRLQYTQEATEEW